MCKKALTDRLQVIIEWVTVSKNNQGTSFPRFRNQYARLWNQLKLSLQELDTLLCQARQVDCWTRASQTVLDLGIQRMLDALEHVQAKNSVLFYQDLWHTPELILDTSGEMVIMPELYAIPGLEPWVACLRSTAAEPETPQQILSHIGDYKDARWYRNFGIEALLCRLLGQTPRTVARSAMRLAYQWKKTSGSSRAESVWTGLRQTAGTYCGDSFYRTAASQGCLLKDPRLCWIPPIYVPYAAVAGPSDCQTDENLPLPPKGTDATT